LAPESAGSDGDAAAGAAGSAGGGRSVDVTGFVGALRGAVTGTFGNGGCGGPSGPIGLAATGAGGGAEAAGNDAPTASSPAGRAGGGAGRGTAAGGGGSGVRLAEYCALVRSATRPCAITPRAAVSIGAGRSGTLLRFGYGAFACGGGGRSSATLPPSMLWYHVTGFRLVCEHDVSANASTATDPRGTTMSKGGFMRPTMVATPAQHNPRHSAQPPGSPP
jgi:hypothetical protein